VLPETSVALAMVRRSPGRASPSTISPAMRICLPASWPAVSVPLGVMRRVVAPAAPVPVPPTLAALFRATV
jgi:hypothetical protein